MFTITVRNAECGALLATELSGEGDTVWRHCGYILSLHTGSSRAKVVADLRLRSSTALAVPAKVAGLQRRLAADSVWEFPKNANNFVRVFRALDNIRCYMHFRWEGLKKLS